MAAERPPGAGPLTVLFVAGVLALTVLQAPYERFSRFAYADSGADLVIRDLIARGYRPTLDFGYLYGLLPLLINRAWYGAFGPTPTAFRALTLLCGLATAWGLARFAADRRVGAAGVALILLALPDILQDSYIVLVQALEPALLVHALAEQARGRRGVALALVTASAFVKPSMAYLYGMILLVAIALASRGEGWRARLRGLGPAAATGAILAALLAAIYGVRPLVNSLVPGAALEVYRESGYGFFRGSGRDFWWRPGVGLRGYLRYEVGAWLAGSLCLIVGGLAGLRRLAWGCRTAPPAANDEVVATCALLHAGFVTFFFGNRYSWIYYYAILLLGLAAMAARGRRHAALVWCLAALVLVADRAKVQTTYRSWRTDAPSAETLGLWATPEERAGWSKVLELTRGRRPALLANVEGAALLVPGFAPPVGAYFVPGHPRPSEIRRKADQLASSSMVVVVGPRGLRHFERWPEIAAALDGCEPVWQGGDYRVYRRTRPPAHPPGPSAAPTGGA